MMNKLPSDVLDIIYKYDGRYYENMKNVVNDLNNKIKWSNIILEAMIGSYWYCPSELDETMITPFYKYYFNQFGNNIKRKDNCVPIRKFPCS